MSFFFICTTRSTTDLDGSISEGESYASPIIRTPLTLCAPMLHLCTNKKLIANANVTFMYHK